jgi:hypothetical protein
MSDQLICHAANVMSCALCRGEMNKKKKKEWWAGKPRESFSPSCSLPFCAVQSPNWHLLLARRLVGCCILNLNAGQVCLASWAVWVKLNQGPYATFEWYAMLHCSSIFYLLLDLEFLHDHIFSACFFSWNNIFQHNRTGPLHERHSTWKTHTILNLNVIM